jgi:methionine-gamma-lyase
VSNQLPLTGISSVAIHTANNNDSYSHLTPIYATSTFVFDTAEQGMERFASVDKEQIYSRWGNPTFKAAEETIAALEAFGLKNHDGNSIATKSIVTCKWTSSNGHYVFKQFASRRCGIIALFIIWRNV